MSNVRPIKSSRAKAAATDNADILAMCAQAMRLLAARYDEAAANPGDLQRIGELVVFLSHEMPKVALVTKNALARARDAR